MKAYEDLTHRGKLRRLRRIAQTALEAFGLTKVSLRFMVDAGNILYRVKTTDPIPLDGNLYVENCYLLRLHWPGYQTQGAVDSELKWLAALSEAGLPVPQPIPTIEGELSVEIAIPGVPKERKCSLLRWVKGRIVNKLVRPWHMKAIGRLIARLHNHASNWSMPPDFVRRHYDRNGLWGDDTGTGYSSNEVWTRIPRRYFKAFKDVTTRVERVMDDWGKRPDFYGLIHADLGTKANILFHGGDARAIDFDDSGFGYWIYDLAVPMADWEGEDVWSVFREALLEGYSGFRIIPDEQLEKLELFQASVHAMEIFWGTASTIYNPNSTYWQERREEAWRHIKRYLKNTPRR